VAAHDWATWHLNNQPQTAKCQSLMVHVLPPVKCRTAPVSLPRVCHRQLLTSSRATCHPYSGDTCHPWIGPTVCPYAKSACHVSPPGACHVICMDRTTCTVSMPRGTVRTVQSSPLFLPVCLFGQNAISCAYGARLTK
jgi:hypothetical protein